MYTKHKTTSKLITPIILTELSNPTTDRICMIPVPLHLFLKILWLRCTQKLLANPVVDHVKALPNMPLLKRNLFSLYRSVLGELMYAYIMCWPDIRYAVTTLSEFSTFPTQYNYSCLRGVVQYLSRIKKWEIRYNRTCDTSKFHRDLNPGDFSNKPPPFPDDFPKFLTINLQELTAYTDAA